MKRAEYYINVELSDKQTEYPKVSGYVEEVADSEGNIFTIGYSNVGTWVATELTTGCACSTGTHSTKADCVKWVHNNIDLIADVMYRKLHYDKAGAVLVQRFRDFVNSL